MSFGGGSIYPFGHTYVVPAKGKHEATVVWLHGLGDNGFSQSQLLQLLPLPNIKWICPTAPTRPVSSFGGVPSTAWFDVGILSLNAQEDSVGLDASAAHVADLLSTEPPNVKLAVGGFSLGAATTLYCATRFALGKYENGKPFPPNFSAAVALSGFLPSANKLRSSIGGNSGAARRAASLPVLVCHGTGDTVVPFVLGQSSSQIMSSSGFRNLTFKSYNGLGHFTNPQETNDLCAWLTSNLGLQSQS